MMEAVQILVVEDSPTQAAELKHVLDGQDYEVRLAGTGEEALAILETFKPNLIITDIVMPGMDGYEFCRRVKSDREMHNIPVILLTSLSDPKDVIRGLECEADNFISKPYEEHYLLSRIKHILINRELRESRTTELGVEVFFAGQKYHLTSERLQIIDFLLTTYETVVIKNDELEREIAERKRVEKELQKANTELKGFAHTVSHDLKGPLTAMRTASDTLQELISEEPSEEAAGDIHMLGDIIDNNVVKMAGLIDDVLELAEAGQEPKEVTDVDVRKVVDTILEEKASVIEDGHIRVLVDDDMGSVRANETQVYQVFTNLLGNAMKHSGSEEPLIEVSYLGEENGDGHRYLVRDNGSGIPPDALTKIFIPFYKGETGNTGIGLSTVEKIVGVYGGDITAYNDNGACFEFTLYDHTAT